VYGATGEPFGVLVDENGIVRCVIRARTDLLNEALVRDVQAWDDGRLIYDGQCARCHGSDGKNISYPNIKSLAGIGNHFDEAEIFRRTELTGVVDLSPLSAKDRRALSVYVAGL
jgi:cytochrome c553